MSQSSRKTLRILTWLSFLALLADSAATDFALPIQITSEHSVNATATLLGSETALVGLDAFDQWTAPPGPGLAIFMYAPQVAFYLEADAQPWLSPYHTPVRWQISIRNNTQTLQLTWNAAQLPEISGGRFLLSNTAEGVVDMQAQSSAHVNAGEVNLYVDYAWSPTLPVEMYGLSAQPCPEGVLLSWKTSMEIELLGFRVLRAATLAGVYLPAPGELISAKGGSAADNSYQYLDHPEKDQTTWYYKIAAVDRDGSVALYGPVSCSSVLATDFRLEQNYPNPFSGATQIGFYLPGSTPVRGAIYNIRGQLVQIVIDEEMPAGYHTVRFSMHRAGQSACGVYRFELTAGTVRQSRNFVYTGR